MPTTSNFIRAMLGLCLFAGMMSTTALADGYNKGRVGGYQERSGGYKGYARGNLGLVGGYVGLDATSISVENSDNEEATPRGLRLRLGMRISHAFDIEMHLGSGSDSSVNSFDRFGTTYVAGYLKGYLPVGRRSALYGLAGFSGIEFSQRLDRQRFSDDRSALSFGFGLETQISRFLDLSADYVVYTLDDEQFSDLSAVNIGLKYYF